MNETAAYVQSRFKEEKLTFTRPPVLIGGRAMEYYGIRKAGADIDLVIADGDYQVFQAAHPECRKDIYGDLGVVFAEFEIWRSIALLDYEFFCKDAVEEGELLVVSIDRLLWTRVCAMDVEKYRQDLLALREYYYQEYRNPSFLQEADRHMGSYQKLSGTVFAGKYED